MRNFAIQITHAFIKICLWLRIKNPFPLIFRNNTDSVMSWPWNTCRHHPRHDVMEITRVDHRTLSTQNKWCWRRHNPKIEYSRFQSRSLSEIRKYGASISELNYTYFDSYFSKNLLASYWVYNLFNINHTIV